MRFEDFYEAYRCLRVEERAAISAALIAAQEIVEPADRAVVVQRVMNIALARRRGEKRRSSDAMTDGIRRVTIGARVRAEYAEHIRREAAASGRSVYRFVLDAVAAELGRREPPRRRPVENYVENWQRTQGAPIK